MLKSRGLFSGNGSSSGASVVEYGLVAGLVSVVAIASVSGLGKRASLALEGSVVALDEAIFPTDPNCYDPANLGTVGQAGWNGCEGMLIVSEASLRAAASSSTYEIVGPDAVTYTFADSPNRIFTGQVTDMSKLFAGTLIEPNNFNGDIEYWDTSNVKWMNEMLSGAGAFNQDISGWCVTNIPSKPTDFDLAAGFAGNSALQPQWGACPP